MKIRAKKTKYRNEHGRLTGSSELKLYILDTFAIGIALLELLKVR